MQYTIPHAYSMYMSAAHGERGVSPSVQHWHSASGVYDLHTRVEVQLGVQLLQLQLILGWQYNLQQATGGCCRWQCGLLRWCSALHSGEVCRGAGGDREGLREDVLKDLRVKCGAAGDGWRGAGSSAADDQRQDRP